MKLNYVLFFKWGGHKSRHKTMYHMCKTWLKEVHGGWVWGVTFKNKYTYKVNSFFICFISCQRCQGYAIRNQII